MQKQKNKHQGHQFQTFHHRVLGVNFSGHMVDDAFSFLPVVRFVLLEIKSFPRRSLATYIYVRHGQWLCHRQTLFDCVSKLSSLEDICFLQSVLTASKHRKRKPPYSLTGPGTKHLSTFSAKHKIWCDGRRPFFSFPHACPTLPSGWNSESTSERRGKHKS